MVHVEDGGFMKVGETDPCIKLWPHTVPLLMACFGLLSHVPVGRTGDPVLEHQLVAGIGTLGMLIGNIAWYVLASATARCMSGWATSWIDRFHWTLTTGR